MHKSMLVFAVCILVLKSTCATLDFKEEETDGRTFPLFLKKPFFEWPSGEEQTGTSTTSSCRAGFSVRKASVYSHTANARVQFQGILSNIGGWDWQRHEFVAPCEGIYFFTFHAISPKNTDFTMALVKNNMYQVTAYGARNEFQSAGNSAVLTLNRGDRVYLQLTEGSIYEHPYNEAYTSFSGFLVGAVC